MCSSDPHQLRVITAVPCDRLFRPVEILGDGGNHNVHLLESFVPASLVIALANEHDVSGIWVLVLVAVPWWWRWEALPPLVLTLSVVTIPVLATPVRTPPIVMSSFI